MTDFLDREPEPVDQSEFYLEIIRRGIKERLEFIASQLPVVHTESSRISVLYSIFGSATAAKHFDAGMVSAPIEARRLILGAYRNCGLYSQRILFELCEMYGVQP